MPELFEDPTFWVAVAFVIFLGALGPRVVKLVTAALDKRTQQIKHELEEAVRLRDEAQTLLASYQRKQREALKEVEAILTHARDDAERITAEAEAEIEATLARRRAQAIEKIARAEAQAAQEVRVAAVDLALRATRKLIADHLDAKRDAKFVSDATAEIAKKLH